MSEAQIMILVDRIRPTLNERSHSSRLRNVDSQRQLNKISLPEDEIYDRQCDHKYGAQKRNALLNSQAE